VRQTSTVVAGYGTHFLFGWRFQDSRATALRESNTILPVASLLTVIGWLVYFWKGQILAGNPVQRLDSKKE
jgi:hypothetical protein